MSMNTGFALVFLSTIASAVLAFFSLSVTWSLLTPGAIGAWWGLFVSGWWVAAAVGVVVGLLSGLVVSVILDGLPARPVYRAIPLVSIGVGVVTAPFLFFWSAIAVVAAQLFAAWALYAKLNRTADDRENPCASCGYPLAGLDPTKTNACPECGDALPASSNARDEGAINGPPALRAACCRSRL